MDLNGAGLRSGFSLMAAASSGLARVGEKESKTGAVPSEHIRSSLPMTNTCPAIVACFRGKRAEPPLQSRTPGPGLRGSEFNQRPPSEVLALQRCRANLLKAG